MTEIRDVLDDKLVLRINSDDLKAFKTKAKAAGKPYQILLRELITAVIDDRARITPTEAQTKLYASKPDEKGD